MPQDTEDLKAALRRIRRVANLIAMDATTPGNAARGREIALLVDMVERKLSGPATDSDVA